MSFKKFIPLFPPKVAFAIDMFIGLIFAFGIYVYSEKQIDNANERRIISYQLGNQLRHSSDDLTRMARTYVVTGEARYKNHYLDILEIRNGNKPRPEGYFYAYWDMVIANPQNALLESGRVISLLDLMRENGFTEEEFDKLKVANSISDSLGTLEWDAIKLSESVGPEAASNREKAIKMLFDDNYHQTKARVMAPINEFHQEMEERTHTAVHKAQFIAVIFMVVFSLGLIAASIMLWRAYVGLRNKLGGTAEEVQNHMNRIGHGDFYSPQPATAPPKDSILAGLFEMQTKLQAHEIERNRSAEVLQQSQQDLEEAQRIAHIGSWQTDPAFNHIVWSAELYRIFGLNPDLPPPCYDDHAQLFTPESWDRLNQAMSGIRESATSYALELEIVRVDGEHRWALVRGEALKNTSGEIIELHGVAADITDRKQAEAATQTLRDQLIQATKMEAVGHLTAGIAHDFNNMLGSIMGYTELSKLKITTGKDTSKVADYLEEILTASNRAKELIAQMLAFSRAAPDSKNEQVPVTLLTPVIKEVTYLIRASIPSTIDFNYQIEDMDIKARIQPVNLHQIIMNLGINARDAIGEYGKINITLTKQSVSENICASCNHAFEGEFAKLTVSDSGSGIPAHILKNIFNPFFTTKEVGKGTGMGLAVVHGLIHSLGGHILVESMPGKGTAISMLLPIVQSVASEESKSEKLESSSDSLLGIRIMLVDDEIAITSMLSEVLSLHGAHIISFNSSIAAWSVFELESDEVDLVITDETMPGLTGMHLAQRMLKLRPELPIILCTGYSANATPELAEQAGIAAFLNKPLNMQEIISKIKAVTK